MVDVNIARLTVGFMVSRCMVARILRVYSRVKIAIVLLQHFHVDNNVLDFIHVFMSSSTTEDGILCIQKKQKKKKLNKTKPTSQTGITRIKYMAPISLNIL